MLHALQEGRANINLSKCEFAKDSAHFWAMQCACVHTDESKVQAIYEMAKPVSLTGLKHSLNTVSFLDKSEPERLTFHILCKIYYVLIQSRHGNHCEAKPMDHCLG